MQHATFASTCTALDPDAAALLVRAQEAGYPPFEALTPTQARKAYAASWAIMQTPGGDVHSVLDVEIEADEPLKLRIYRGLTCDEKRPAPCMLFLHGGGWVIGNLESHDRMCRQLANMAGMCVVAVDYRLAPEHPYPAALRDASAALQWVIAHADELNIAPHAVGVGGDSAGGNLAAVLALMSRDKALSAICLQALFYPATDLTAVSGSYRRFTSGLPLTASTMHYFIDHYVPVGMDKTDWRISPLHATSFKGVAPAIVMTVAHDPLCDEGRAYAKRLDEDGVRVAAFHYNDHMHGVLSQGNCVDMANGISQQVFSTVGQYMHQALKRSTEASATPRQI